MRPLNLLAVALVLIVVAALLPAWPYSATWGYRPVSVGTVIAIFLILWLLGAI